MGDRRIRLNYGRAQLDEVFTGNKVKTSKYTWGNFLPKNLFEQLHKFGNVYFLFISVVMYLGEKTDLYVGTIKAFSTLGLLVMMMSVTAAVALYDDIQRKNADYEINMSDATVLVDGKEARRRFEDLKVGDVLVVKKDQDFPADTVPLHCSGEGGNCYVSTANLDGETNLKLKTAPAITQSAVASSSLMKLDIEIHAEEPNGNIHDFNGNIAAGGQKASLGPKQLLMRGTVLRNTDRCLCVIVYTGDDTRMVKNSRPAPMKQSNLERTTNSAMLIVLCAQALISLTCAILHMLLKPVHHWYLEEERIILPEMIGWWLTFFTLYSNLMPISLYPTVEFCNAFQCRAIRTDKKMIHEFSESGEVFQARTRSTNLSQELGQVGYVFSDKTGTLTQNDMVLRRLSIGGKKYGTFTEAPATEAGFNGGEKLEADRSSNKAIDRFLEVLSVSHTVMATWKDGALIYEAESPDEYALVKAAAGAGYEFQGRRGNEASVGVRLPHQEKAQDVTYTLLATNEFNSARKRMSVLVKKGGEHLLFVKGADNVMLERAAQCDQRTLAAHLQEFAEEGLRTLVIGYRSVSGEEAQQWLSQFQEAQRATVDRDEKLGQVAEKIEKALEIVGATAIEDKLQDGVPAAIETIRNAGIKLWVLTGDKLETARNIGFSTKVLTTSMDIRILDDELGESIDTIEEAWDCYSEDEEEEEEDEATSKRALMVTGKLVSYIWDTGGDVKKKFKRISTSCAVLIACRVSPLQKAELVQFIRDTVVPTPVTLAIGDGANDVPMIQTAQVGVGIAGREGRQAVNNSDFAIGQFRFLVRLLLLHGRWNYRRACMFTLFTFWRNMVQVLMIVFYTFISGYSGTSLFEDWIRLTFNGVCTMPILPGGCMDEDFDEEVILQHPSQYQVGPRSEDLNPWKVVMTIAVALLHAFVIIVVTLLAFPGLECAGSGDYYTFGTICYTCLIIDVNYRATFLSNKKSRPWTMIVALVAFLMYTLYLGIYTFWRWICDKLTPNMYRVPEHMVVGSAYFWICIMAVPFIAFVYDMFFHWLYHRVISPDRTDVLREQLEEEELAQGKRLLDCNSSDEETGSGSETERLMECRRNNLPLDILSCDQLPYDLKVCGLAIIGGSVLQLLFVWCYCQSHEKAQLRIIYDDKWVPGSTRGSSWMEEMFLAYPIGTDVQKEVINATMPRDDATVKVSFQNVSVPGFPTETHIRLDIKKMPFNIVNPLLIYTVGPMYQNYNYYMKSEVYQELYGQEAPPGKREARCPDRVRIRDGKELVPCGLKAQSLFNDSFKVGDFHIDSEDVAWPSDVHRYNNQTDYPTNPNKIWLHDVFPETVSEAQNVKDRDFVNWMRPSAVPRVWNKIGELKGVTLEKGQSYVINIESRFDVDSIPGGFKSFVITEYNVFGARHDGFAYGLGIGGAICFFMAFLVPLSKWIKMRIQ